MTTQPLLVQLGAYGDIMTLLPICYHHAQKGNRLGLMVSHRFADILDGVSYVNKVVFDGEAWEIEKAVMIARGLSNNVRVTQVNGPPDIIKKYAYEPMGSDHGLCENFELESWRLAGELDLWKEQPPLVFDRRDKEREEKLCIKHIGDNRDGPSMLVSTDGKSSPFAPKELLYELLRLRFGDYFKIVSLDDIKAERIYDLLGLYERAFCLVTTDSAPLHLAQAYPRLPVLAMVNDSPGLGFGSAWRPNHIFHCRYGDFAKRAVDMLKVIGGLRSCYNWWPLIDDKPGVIHVWSQYEVQDKVAQDNWQKVFVKKLWVETPIQLGMCGRDSRNAIKDTGRFPFLRDVIELACLRARPNDIILLTRPDTCFHETFKWLGFAEERPCFQYRRIMEAEGETHHPAVDLFAFTKKWWREHGHDLPDLVMARDRFWQRILLELLKLHGGTEVRGAVFCLPRRESVPSQLPPRYFHNEKIANQWLNVKNITSTCPAVKDQIQMVPLNRKGLSKFAYNGSLIRWKDRMLLAYRWHSGGTLATSLMIAELDDQWNVKRNTRIDTVTSHSTEDPRLFVYRGDLWMSYVESTWPERPPKCVVKYCKLLEDHDRIDRLSGGGSEIWSIGEQYVPVYGQNDWTGLEKNWAFWENPGGLYCLYSCHPEQVVLDIVGFKVLAEHRSKAIHWPWGKIKSGIAPVPWKGKLLRFFHTHLDNESRPNSSRYYVGASLMEPEPPFATIAVSSEPILTGSELDDLAIQELTACFHRKQLVVYPMGCVPVQNGWLLSLGINDCQCSIAHVQEKDLKLP